MAPTTNSASPIDVLVIGGGPAGLTAATYLSRFHRSCVVLDSGKSRARWIPESNNCPGFPQGVSGVDLLARMRKQAILFGTRLVSDLAECIERRGEAFCVRSATGEWTARCVILANGLPDRLPDGDWVEAAIECGALRLCSICDAFEATDTRIGVYGAAQVIADHALFLRTYSSRVFLIPSHSPRETDGPALREAVAAGVHLLPGGGSLGFDGTRCNYTAPDGTSTVLDSLYPFLGSLSAAGFATSTGVALNDEGEIDVDAEQMTNVPNLFAIGDAVTGLKQISVAAGQAAVAATTAHDRLPFVPRDKSTKGSD